MKKILMAVFVFTIIIIAGIHKPILTYATDKGTSLTILFTHDMHDHFYPVKVQEEGIISVLGGFARLQSAISIERKQNPNLVIVDAGDFSMGTLFQSIYASDASELRLMGTMGYDVVTLGNHEFDFRVRGITDSLKAAKTSGDKLPQIVAANITYPVDKAGNLTKSLAALKNSMDNYGVKDYTILSRDGYKIGVFGLMGSDAAACAPMSGVKFSNEVTAAKKVVAILKNKEKVDLIICLSHSGIWPDKSDSEDEILASKVPGIHVIISGHTHTKLIKPIIVGKTIIGSCGEYGENLGIINISQKTNKSWMLNSYNLKPIDKTLPKDTIVSKKLENYEAVVQSKYLNNYKMKFDDVLAYSPYNFLSTRDLGLKHAEDTLGDLISDSYIYAVKKAEGSKYEQIAAAIVPLGTIRGSFVKGNVTVADAFTVSSLGIGPDNVSGYPLVSAYVTGKELKAICELDASITPIMRNSQLFMSGVSFSFNPHRLTLNKVTSVKLQNSDGNTQKIDNKKLYRVVVNLYSAQMLMALRSKSFGLISVTPKTKDGKTITDFDTQILTYMSNGHSIEIKECLTVADYLQSFKKINGVPQIPQYYNELHGRKIVEDSYNIIAILSNPNSIALTIYGIVTLIISGIIFIIIMTIRRRKIVVNK